MPPVSPQPQLSDEDKTFIWRFECLKIAGVPKLDAKKLAEGEGDLHQMLDALHRGCTMELLIDIFE